jgi:hypothetical protein
MYQLVVFVVAAVEEANNDRYFHDYDGTTMALSRLVLTIDIDLDYLFVCYCLVQFYMVDLACGVDVS